MYTTYHLNSAQEINTDILEAIKPVFKTRPITIIVQEDSFEYDLTDEMKSELDNRLQENEETYISAEESLKLLNEKQRCFN
jgi:hypothetical protein